MWLSMKEGWTLVRRQPFLLLALFLYQFVWGFVLYRFVQSVVEPLLHRYPGGALPTSSVHLFLAESEFRLFKTDLAYPTLWWLLGFLTLRMLLSPVLDAGIYYSLHHPELNGGYRFFRGIRQLGKPFAGYYGIRMVLTLLPLYWLAPALLELFRRSPRYEDAVLAMLPYLAAFLAYGVLIHLLFVMMMLHRTVGGRWTQFWLPSLRCALPMTAISAAVWLIASAVGAMFLSASFIWAGLLALLLNQLYPFVRIWFNLWAVASQYQLWLAKK